MATIGTLTKHEDGNFTGNLKTLGIVTRINLTANDKNGNSSAPDFRATANGADIGAAWEKVNGDGQPHLNLKLDDPSWPAPVFSTVVQRDGADFDIIWSRK